MAKVKMETIKEQVRTYQTRMAKISEVLQKYYEEHPEIPEKEQVHVNMEDDMGFSISKEELLDLVRTTQVHGCDSITALFGMKHIGEPHGTYGKQLTCCMLGTDKEGICLPEQAFGDDHFPPPPPGKGGSTLQSFHADKYFDLKDNPKL
ncbi:MAG: hypothetical protein LBE82_09885 [Chitinophagaceae bacterium]|jgi:hypothetical protein|nr:hypothetical protein [Chitinophagaceae bacterium]